MSESELFANRYRIVGTLGSGGMGIVYRALDTVLNKQVALKTLRGGLFSTEQIVRFQSEAKALSALKHPNIVEVLVFGLTEDNLPYLVMDFIDGKSLETLVHSRGYIPAYKSVNIFIALCDGLSHVHNNGVLHRDLKPANIMLMEPDSLHPRPIVVDFGIARLENSGQSLTKPGSIIGTPVYMSPEVLKGKSSDARSDIYSVGCIMYETLTGQRPFDGANELEIIAQKLDGNPPRLDQSTANLTFPEGLETVVAKTLATDPNQRYQDIDELKNALSSLKAGELQATTRQHKTTSAPVHKQKRIPLKHLALWALGVCTSIAVLATITGIAMTPPETPKISDTVPYKDKAFYTEVEDLHRAFLIVPQADGQAVKIESPYESNATDKDLLEQLKRKRANKIVSLDIIHQPITGSMFRELKGQPLRTVFLRGTKINEEGLKLISQIKTIETFRIEDTVNISKTGLTYLGDLPRLNQLSLPSCDIDIDYLKILSVCKNIKWLDLENNGRVDGECLRYIVKTFRHVDGFDLGGTGVKPVDFAILAPIKKLVHLKLERLKLNDAALEQLPMFPELNALYIDENPDITDKGIMRLLRYKKLNMLGVIDTSVTNEGKNKFEKQSNCIVRISHGRINMRAVVDSD